MKKKLLAMVLAAATAMTMLAGCGGDDKAAGTKDNKEASADAGEKKRRVQRTGQGKSGLHAELRFLMGCYHSERKRIF